MDAAAQELHRLRVALKRTREKKRRLERGSVVPGVVVSDYHRRVAVCLCLLGKGTAEVATAYLQRNARGPSGEASRALAIAVGRWTRAAVEGGSDDLLAPFHRVNVVALRKARRFLQEAKLVDWVRQQNEVKGLAPTAEATLRQHYSHSSGAPLAVDGEMPRTGAGRRKWMCRWAKRWAVSRGMLKAGTVVPLEERRAKVELMRQSANPGSQNCARAHTFSPNSLPIFRSEKQDQQIDSPALVLRKH